MDTFLYKRIVVIGTTSSGKSTLAKQIAEKFNFTFIELDALHWEPNWREADDEVFRQRVKEAIQAPTWVSAGNYSVVRDILWKKAEAVIWLDYSFWIVFWRLFTRTIQRIITQEELWHGNRESFWTQIKFWSDNSVFNWFIKTYWRRKRETPILLAKYPHLKVIHFRHPNETETWLQT